MYLCLRLYQLGEQRDTRAACKCVCVCAQYVRPAQSTREILLCAAGWMKSVSAPQGMVTIPWVFTQSGCPALPQLSVTLIALTAYTKTSVYLSIYLSISSITFPHNVIVLSFTQTTFTGSTKHKHAVMYLKCSCTRICTLAHTSPVPMW